MLSCNSCITPFFFFFSRFYKVSHPSFSQASSQEGLHAQLLAHKQQLQQLADRNRKLEAANEEISSQLHDTTAAGKVCELFLCVLETSLACSPLNNVLMLCLILSQGSVALQQLQLMHEQSVRMHQEAVRMQTEAAQKAHAQAEEVCRSAGVVCLHCCKVLLISLDEVTDLRLVLL